MINKTVSPSSFIFIFFFVLMAFSYQSCVSARNRSIKEWERHEWRIVKTDKNNGPTWVIYTRKIDGTNFLEYKIVGDIGASPKACLASFKQDIRNQANDLQNKKYPTYEIVEESQENLLTYLIHNEPFPFKDTEMSVRYTFINDEDGSSVVKWNEAWDESQIQPSRKLNRVQTFRGSWDFSPTSDTFCKAENSVQFDPKKMPLWLVEPMVFKFLKEGLEDLREMTSK